MTTHLNRLNMTKNLDDDYESKGILGRFILRKKYYIKYLIKDDPMFIWLFFSIIAIITLFFILAMWPPTIISSWLLLTLILAKRVYR